MPAIQAGSNGASFFIVESAVGPREHQPERQERVGLIPSVLSLWSTALSRTPVAAASASGLILGWGRVTD